MEALSLPPKVERAIRWLVATLEGECGPDHPEFKVPMRHLVFKGGRGSGKSHTVARVLINLLAGRPWRALCTRETQKSIDESVKQLLDDCIVEMDADTAYDSTKTSISGKCGSQIIFAGLRSQDIAKLKSTEKIKIAWVEEAHVISSKSIQVLTPTVREPNSVIIWTYNPELDDDPVNAEIAIDPAPNVCVVELNYSDNPWFPEVLELERQRSYEKDTTPDKHVYNWIWEGRTLPAVHGAIFANEVSSFRSENRYRPIDIDRMGHVHVVMDLGYGVTTMALVQRFGSTVQVVDYYEFYQSKYSVMSSIVRQDHPHVTWGKMFMPHDAAHRDPKTGNSHKEVMRQLGWKVEDVEQIGVENYIDKGRELFDTAYIDNKDHTPDYTSAQYVRGGGRLMQCLQRYRRQVPETTGHPGSPMKDEFSHGGETWCYIAVCAKEMTNKATATVDPYGGFR